MEKHSFTLGEKIRALRLKKGYSLDELSKLSKISPTTLTRIESNNFKNMPTNQLEKLAPILGTSIEYLLLSNEFLKHLSDELIEFVLNPESANYIELAYLDWKKNKILNRHL